MEQLFDLLMFLLGKVFIFLPFAFVVRFLAEKAMKYNATFLSVYAALLAGNLLASFLVTGLFWLGFMEPHGNEQEEVIRQISITYAAMLVLSVTSIVLLFRDQAGQRISLIKGCIIGFATWAVPVAMTAFYWITAV